ncbi:MULTISPECIES: ATP-binding cassette domain-containing protein [Eubacteriales]|uniref:ATP-binding cassette domain-containing protein n=1 Tax=Bittarella massiliensis (ex Durand et al. 2017) TaxID=1720313 RepID=A0AAQ1MBR6_9FIRM|nr:MULTISPECIES: ATP-binding cassette domain-containing protein [Eubacteriales]ERI98138.1 ABC transporter, ATP-binding protein [Clostridium sp. ATCC 29733]MZL69584.1 ATP-binding cassette domain-containing protein [Bittarella massiliensis (ex Durand et al. 2017)]MZL80501.1 ATP-binding cassette domain-containing protein [Bittarella massiliensis (ex Durand et al. 2017)]SHF79012.1 NitT/TauT family transport system ATP-binding protein/sulfonate transport system ATP-binding protein [Bittarella massil
MLVSFQKVSLRLGEKEVLRDFSLDLQNKGIYGVIGPSGCGKTTLLNLIQGFLQPDAGEIALFSDRISAVFQENRLLPWYTVYQNIALAARRPVGREEVEALLRRLCMPGELDSLPGSLSGGMARRVALARALLSESDILLLDEPFKGVDMACKRQCEKTLQALSGGRLTLLVTHDPGEAAALCDTAILVGGSPLRLRRTLRIDPQSRGRSAEELRRLMLAE